MTDPTMPSARLCASKDMPPPEHGPESTGLECLLRGRKLTVSPIPAKEMDYLSCQCLAWLHVFYGYIVPLLLLATSGTGN